MTDQIRLAAATDCEQILEIYAPYVRNTAISFETCVPTVQEFAERIAAVSECYPYLVYLSDGRVAAYAYASRHRERAAYCYAVDVSVYCSPEYHGQGVAQALYRGLFAILKELGYCNAYAGYTVPNEKSRKFHEKFGFTSVGTYHAVGYKLGRWHDVTWMEKIISDHAVTPRPVKKMAELSQEAIRSALMN